MRLEIHISALVLLVCLFSCTSSQKDIYSTSLLMLEDSLKTHPENATGKIFSADTSTMGEADKALLRFLQIKAWGMTPATHPGILNEPERTLAHFTARKDSGRLCQLYYYMGRIHVRNYAFFRGNNSYKQAEKFAAGNDRMLAAIKIGEAHIYRFKMMHDTERKCLLEALALGKKLNDSLLMADAMHELAELRITEGYFRQADQRLRSALALLPAGHPSLRAEYHKDMGRVHMSLGQPDSALFYLDLALKGNPSHALELSCNIIRGNIYRKMHRLGEAEYFFMKDVQQQPLDERHKIYFQMSLLKKEEGQLLAACDYAERSIACRDSLANDNKIGYISNLNAFQEHERQQKKIESMNEELSRQELAYYRLATALSLVLVLSTSLVFHFKHTRKKVEMALKEKELAVVRLQNSQWESEVKYLKEKHEREEAEIESLNQTLEYYKQLNALTVPILMKSRNSQGYIHLKEEEWNIIIQNANACFNNFTQRLKEAYPELTEEEIRFICLLKMEFPISSLSEVYHIAKGSISRKKMRLKEKMHIEDMTLDDFIKQF